MKKYTFLLLILTTSFISLCQESPKWEVGLDMSHQFGVNKRGDNFINVYGEDSGIQQIGISIKRSIVETAKFKLQGGLSLSREHVSSVISVNHCNGSYPCFDILIAIGGYSVDMFGFPLDLEYSVFRNLSATLGINPQVRFHQNATASFDAEAANIVEFHSIEMYTGLIYQFKRIDIGLGYRLLNMKKPDPVFELSHRFEADHPDYYDKTFDYYNPVKLRLSVGYKFGFN